MVGLTLKLEVKSVDDAHRLRRILKRPSFPIPNKERDFTLGLEYMIECHTCHRFSPSNSKYCCQCGDEI